MRTLTSDDGTFALQFSRLGRFYRTSWSRRPDEVEEWVVSVRSCGW